MRKRGIALVTVLMVIGILATITAAVITMGTGTLKTSFQNLQSEKALYAADAAGKLALVELANSASWPGLPLQNFGSGPEQIQVDIFASGSTTPHGLTVPAGQTYVLATGISERGLRRQVGMTVTPGAGSLDFAVVADQSITLDGGSHIDSRDPLTDAVLPDPSNIATNAITPPAIALSGGSSIAGNANAGKDAAPGAIQVTGGSSISGTQGNLTAPIPLDPVVLPSDPSLSPPTSLSGGVTQNLSPGVFGNVTVNGGSRLILAPGVYVFNELSLSGGGQMEISGGTEIYVKGDVNILVSSVINPSKNPSDLKFYVETGDVTVQAGGTAYYILYAPDSPVNLDGGADIYGTVVGEQLSLTGGSYVHFDPSTSGAAIPGGGTTVLVESYQRF